MRKFIRPVSFFLSLILIIPSLFGCRTEMGRSYELWETEPPATASEEYLESLTSIDRLIYDRYLVKDEVPSITFNGATFGVLAADYLVSDWESDYTADRLSASIAEMNNYVEDRLDVNIVISGHDSITLDREIRAATMGNDDSFQVLYQQIILSGGLAADGYLQDWENVPFVNFDAPWWNQSAREAVRVGSSTYLAVGSACVQQLKSTYCVYFNKELAENYNLPDMYDLVRKGKWTIDEFDRLTRIAYRDLNGNTKVDDYDQFGLAAQITSYATTYIYSFGEMTTSRDENGIPYVDVNTEKMSSIFDKLYHLFYENQACHCNKGWSQHGDIFKDGRALFMNGTFGHALEVFPDMETDYGILPYPKWDEIQQDYYTMADGYHGAIGVLSNTDDLQLVGAVMEVMNARAWQQVQPALYEATLKGRASRDPDSVEMIDIIAKNCVYDFGFIFDGPGLMISKIFSGGSKNFMSYYRSNFRSWNNKFDDIADRFLGEDYKIKIAE